MNRPARFVYRHDSSSNSRQPPIQMQSGGQFKTIEFTALAAKTGAENSEVPKCQRGRIRTREGLACGADQNEPTRTRKLMGFDSSLNERCAARIFKNDRAIIPATFSGSIGQS